MLHLINQRLSHGKLLAFCNIFFIYLGFGQSIPDSLTYHVFSLLLFSSQTGIGAQPLHNPSLSSATNIARTTTPPSPPTKASIKNTKVFFFFAGGGMARWEEVCYEQRHRNVNAKRFDARLMLEKLRNQEACICWRFSWKEPMAVPLLYACRC